MTKKAEFVIFTYTIWGNKIKVKFFGCHFKFFNYTLFVLSSNIKILFLIKF